ncbi:MAG: translocation/assembly module TamB domain-containing protein [Trueperaceae bacterium]|nr:translocation/assembly module TamB domain-containing protein [Trueperaceae bacterium]
MPRRTLLTALIVTLVLGAAALAPGIGAVRDGLLRYLIAAAERQGVSIAYSASSGNAWSGVTLYDLRVDAFGSHLTFDRLRVGYFLPALLGGELPLDAEVEGAGGEIDLSDLDLVASGGSGPTVGFAPRVRLGQVRLIGSTVSVKQIPFTLPDVTISDLTLENGAAGLLIGGELATAEGAARLSGTLDPNTLNFTGVVERADVTLTKHWWPGAVGGTVTGTLAVVNGRISGDFALERGSVADLGMTAEDVSGTVSLRYPVVTAELRGRGMGGEVRASGTVDIGAERFAVTGQATPSLAAAVAWLLRGQFAGELPFEVEGDTTIDLAVSGWRTVDFTGTALADGAVNGLAASDIDAHFSLKGKALDVDSTMTLAGGPVSLTVTTGARGEQLLRVRANDLDLGTFEYAGLRPGGTLRSVSVDLPMGGNPQGRLAAVWAGNVAGADVDLALDGRLDPDGWQAFVSGGGEPGIELSGAVVLADGRLDGGLNLRNVHLDLLGAPVDLALSASGAPTDLALRAEVNGREPVTLALAGLDLSAAAGAAPVDLRGSLTSRLTSGALGPIEGRFGPVALEVAVGTAPLRVEADFTLDPVVVGSRATRGADTPASGSADDDPSPANRATSDVRATLAVPTGHATFADGVLTANATVAIADALAGPLALDVGSLPADLSAGGGGWTLALGEPGGPLTLRLGSDEPLSLVVTDLPTRLEGSEREANVSANLNETDDGYAFTMVAPRAAEAVGVALPLDLTLHGRLAPARGAVTATGTLGELPLAVDVDWAAARRVAVTAAGLNLDYPVAGGAWSATGAAEVEALARALGFGETGATGTVTLDLHGEGGSGGTLSGLVDVTLLEPLPVRLRGVAAGDRLALTLEGDAAGLPVSGAGALSLSPAEGDGPTGAMTLAVGPLTGITVDLSGARGSGELTDLALGPVSAAPLAWALDFSWSELAGGLSLGGERLAVRNAGGQWRLAGALAATATYAGTEYRATLTPGAVGETTATLSEVAALPLSLAVVNTATGARLAEASGTPADLTVTVDAAAAELAAMLPEQFRPDWRVTGEATLDLLNGPRYRASIDLVPSAAQEGEEPLRARLSGTGARADLVLEGAGVYVSNEVVRGAGRLRLRADDAALDRYLPAGMTGTLGGTLVLEQGRWLGALTAQLAGPLTATVKLTGQGEELRVAADAAATGDVRASASGTLAPRLALTGTASAQDGLATATFTWGDGLRGELLTRPLELGDAASLPGMAFDFALDQATGTVTLSARAGAAGALTLTQGALGGRLVVSARTAAGPVTVELTPSGTLADARVQAAVSGALEGSAEASLAAGVSTELLVPATSLAAVEGLGVVSSVMSEPARLAFTLDPGGSWRAMAAAALEADGLPGDLEPAVNADLDGHGLAYAGRLTLANGGAEIAAASVTGEAADLRAELDLGAVDWRALGAAVGLDLEVTGDGRATLTTRPFATELVLDLNARLGDNVLRLTGSAPDDLRVGFHGPAGELDGLLAWERAPGALPAAHLSGTFAGAPLDLRVAGDGAGGGTLAATYGGASLSARVGQGTGTAELAAPTGSLAPVGLLANASVAWGGQGVALTALDAAVSGLLPADDLRLTLSGPVTAAGAGLGDALREDLPGLALTGTLAAGPDLEPATLAVGPHELRLAWRELSATLTASPSDGPAALLDLARARLALTGSATEADVAELLSLFPAASRALADLRVEVTSAELAWTRATGFAGGLTATAAHAGLPEARAELSATGAGGLFAQATLRHERVAGPAAEARLELSADPLADPSVGGTLTAHVPLAAVAPQVGGFLAELGADLQLGGTLTAPTLVGTARLAGDVAASGPVTFADGRLTVRLDGPALRAQGAATLGADPTWGADVVLTDLDIGGWLGQVREPRLSLSASVDDSGVTVSDLRLAAPRSLVTGSGSLGYGAGGLRLNLSAAVDLADIAVNGTELTGTLRGPVAIAATSLDDLGGATITAALDATTVGAGGLGGSVSGTLSLGGSLADPALNADLRGDGRVRGTLTASARPAAGEVQLASNLTFGQLATDLRASLGGGEARVSGSARWGEAVLLLSDVEEGGEGAVRMTGAGRLSGWTASVASNLGWARLEGDLATVQANLTGALRLRLSGDGAGPWLQGTVAGASVAGVALGDLTASSEAPLGTISVTSDHLAGEFDVGTGRWSAELTELTVAADTRLSASGSGALQGGALTARLSGPQLELEARLASADGAIEASLSGQAFGGGLELSAARAAASQSWNGTAGYSGGTLGGFTLDATGTVQGEGALPQLVLLTHAVGPLTLDGRMAVSTAGVTLDQFVAGGPLTQGVRVQGRVYPDTDLTLATLLEAPRPGATASLPTSSQVRLRTVLGAGLTAAGTARLELGPARVTLGGHDSAPVLAAQVVGLPGLRAQTELRANDLIQLVTGVVAHGLELTGTDDVTGSLRIDLTPEPSVTLQGLSAAVAGLDVSADGTVAVGNADMRAEVVFRTDLQLMGGEGDDPGEYRLPVAVTASGGRWRLEYDGPLGLLHGTYDQAGGAVGLDADLRIGGGRVSSRLEHSDGELRGNVQVDGVHLAPAGLGAVSLAVDSTVADGRIGGSVVLEGEAGRLTLTGSWGLAGILPESVVTGAPRGGRLEARLRTLELSKLPVVAARAPYLTGALTGVVQLRDEFVFGQLVSPEISAAGSTSRLELDLSGSLSSLDASLRLKGATVSANLTGNRLSGLGRFERFPAQFLAQAVVGPSDVTADTTGVVRFELPFADLGSSYLRLATEEVRLERAGVPTIGNLTLAFDAGKLVVERADFAGLGSWEAHGELSLDRFDFHLSADDADFTPLLGIVPSLARIGAGATGTFTLDVSGDAAAPQARFASPGLDVALAGSRYRLADTEIELAGANLSVVALLSGVSPLEGALSVAGDARLTLAPLALTDVAIGFDGSLDLLNFGVVQDLSGELTKGAAGELRLDATGRMGAGELALTGSLLPLELSARGTGLTVAFPALLVARALVDADLTLVGEAGGVALGGAVVASEIIVDPGARGPAPAPAGGGPAAQTRPAGGSEPASVLRFADLAIRAPQRVLLSTNLGSGEAALDLVLSGNAADPKLTGTAHALRGNLRFSGRDFTIDRAVATFNRSGGVYPELDVAAHTEFDKSRVLSADNRVSFAAPREGQTFVVELAFTGQMVAAPGEEGGFRFDLQPRVASDARIDIEGEGVRSFTDAELMSLITLGRFELNSGIVATGGLGQAVAQGALDTAIDLFVISELSNALKEALGLDVVEIRTSAISSLIDDAAHPFGVSLRLGGYLNPELFASYRIGTYDGTDGAYSLTNEVMLSYGLGPLDLDVTARVDLPTAGMNESARPEIGVALSYSFGPTFGVDTGVVLSTQRSAFQVGLTLRW